MGSFLQAKQQHRTVAVAAAQNEETAADLWNAIVGVGREPVSGSFAEAVRDTAPMEHATLLATNDVAAAYAFDLMERRVPYLAADASPFALRDAARGPWAEFSERATRTEQLAEGFGWSLCAAWSHTREVNVASGKLSGVERIARLAGRMHAALRGSRSKRVAGVPSEVYSVEQGNDVARLLPAEQVLLTDSMLETVALERIATRRAAQYAVRGTSKQSRGPLVIALDESGSMHARRNEWAKAAAVALARVAFEDKRPVVVVHYSSSAEVQTLRPGDGAAVVAMIRSFLSGGTAIGLALDVAVQQVKALAQKGQKGADIVLVTDGVDGDEAAQTKALDAGAPLGVRLWTVAIECAIPATSPLRARAAHFTHLGARDLEAGSSVTTLGGAV